MSICGYCKDNDEMVYLNDDIDSFDFEASLAKLSSQRREQALRFRSERDRKLCALAYILLCEGLRKEYGITELPVFDYGEHGKPFIIGHPDIHFNISHCREAVVCVLSDRPVGVDVESMRGYRELLVRYTMNDAEISEIEQSACPEIEFIRLWTRKEAVMKCYGSGITNDIKHVLEHNSLETTTITSADNRYVYSVCYGN